MSSSFVTLGTATNLWDAEWSGWAYPPGRRSFLTLLENEVGSTGNEVIQEGAITRRRGRLSFSSEDIAQRDVVQGYDEASTQVEFTAPDGKVCVVLVDNFQASWVSDEQFTVTVDLIQLTEPELPE